MNAALLRVSSFLRQGDYRSAAGPVLIILILAMMVLPLPPFILDLLFTFNIALSIMVLLISMHTLRPLDFSSFPDRKSTRLNSSHIQKSRMPSSA